MLNVQNISVKYDVSDDFYALNNINFSLSKGEKVALIGANGAGKSTLLSTICGILQHIPGGNIALDDISLEKKNLVIYRKKIGMVFQNPDAQLFMPTVYEDIAFGPRNFGMFEKDINDNIDNILSKLGIPHLKNRMSHKLSGGEKRLVALAGILIMNPSILLMDEPSSFLDPRARRKLIEIFIDLPDTMLMATHDLDMALDFCERTILLKEGIIYSDGPSIDILKNTQLLMECGLEPPLSINTN